MALLLEGAEIWKLYEYDIARLENFHALGVFSHLLANKDIKPGTILQMQNIHSR
jgi:hypothetical protein